ncbi:MAG: tRNA (adenosine(37)-N6)-threonylcarbamoyltransferase complex ATPase subunit type 1 TsaE [Pseudomonadota bacterium]
MHKDSDESVIASIPLKNAQATKRLARLIAPHLQRGDIIGLTGELGAGKSHFARALIACRLAALDRSEDIPSPSFTLVQTYSLDGIDLWHVDLYRLADVSEIGELGLEEAFEEGIVVVEWIDRLDPGAPARELRLSLQFLTNSENGRLARLEARGPNWPWFCGVLEQMRGNP